MTSSVVLCKSVIVVFLAFFHRTQSIADGGIHLPFHQGHWGNVSRTFFAVVQFQGRTRGTFMLPLLYPRLTDTGSLTPQVFSFNSTSKAPVEGWAFVPSLIAVFVPSANLQPVMITLSIVAAPASLMSDSWSSVPPRAAILIGAVRPLSPLKVQFSIVISAS